MRLATIKDLPRIVEIYNSTISSRISTADTSPVSIEDKRSWFNAHTSDKPIHVCVKNSKIIGWTSFEHFYGRPAYHKTAEFSIYIDPEFRKQGLGSHAMRYCLDLCPSLGIQNVIGFVFSHNSASLKLFEKFGFSKWGELPEIAEIDGSFYSIAVMGLKLDVT